MVREVVTTGSVHLPRCLTGPTDVWIELLIVGDVVSSRKMPPPRLAAWLPAIVG